MSSTARPKKTAKTSKKSAASSSMTALVTGYPGFIGKRLVRRLLDDHADAIVICLVDEPRKADADADVARLDPGQRARVRIVLGDVRKMDLGLAGLEIAALTDVTHIFHLAAIQSTSASAHTLEAVNVGGVRNVITLARELPKLQRLVHFSSCFVSGDRQGVVLEDDLDAGAATETKRSPYEDSKYRGEKIARQAMSELPISIVRPSVVVGDSATGEVDRFDGVYAMGILIVTSPVGVPVPLPGPGLAPLHIVPVDYLTRVVLQIASSADAVGKTFHVVDPNPLSARMIYELVARRAGKKTAPAVAASGWAAGPVTFAARRASQIASQLSGPWFDMVPGLERVRRGAAAVEHFDRFVVYNASNTAALLAGTDILCPRFDSYVDTLVRFVKDSLREERQTRKKVQDPLL